jgi:hypothetical protein
MFTIGGDQQARALCQAAIRSRHFRRGKPSLCNYLSRIPSAQRVQGKVIHGPS